MRRLMHRSEEPLFDHLVSDREQPWRHLDAERSRRLKVDDELELSRLHHRQIRWLRALEDATGVDAGLPKSVRNAGSVAHQPAGCREFTDPKSRRNPVARRQSSELHAAIEEESVSSDDEGIGAFARKGSKSRVDLADRHSVEYLDLQPHGGGSFPHLPQGGLGD